MTNHRQHVLLLEKSYPILVSNMNLRRDPKTKVQALTARCCIVANDIVDISPWVMEGRQKLNITLRNLWYKKDGSLKEASSYTFHEAICTEYWEEYDHNLNETILWFSLLGEAITRTDGTEEGALKKLLA